MNIKIFSGTNHPKLAQEICAHLGLEVSQAENKVFSNDNRFLSINESVRGDDVFVIQTGSNPVDVSLMELLMYVRTLREASAGRITAVIPYLPYVRSDKKDQPRVCITARLVADLIKEAGADRVLVMELHAPQIQGFFSIPCDHLSASTSIIKYLVENFDLNDYTLVAGDAGAAKMLKIYADALRLPIAIMDKRRDANDEKPKIIGVVGDVKNKKTLIIDDEIASGGTLTKDAKYLIEEAGALSVDACAVHPVLGTGAIETLNNSLINRFIITNSISSGNKDLRNKEIVDISPLLAESIKRIHNNESIIHLNRM